MSENPNETLYEYVYRADSEKQMLKLDELLAKIC